MALVKNGVQYEVPHNIPMPTLLEPVGPWTIRRTSVESRDHGRVLVVAMEAAGPGDQVRRNAVAFVFALEIAEPARHAEAAETIGTLILGGWVCQMNGGPASWVGEGWTDMTDAGVGASRFAVRSESR